MEIEIDNVSGMSSACLYIGVRDGKIEISLDDYCDIVAARFIDERTVDKAIEELTKLRKEVYG